METTARLATQCRYDDNTMGNFLYLDNVWTGPRVSPCFPSLIDLFDWCRAEGWKEVPGTYASEYSKEV